MPKRRSIRDRFSPLLLCVIALLICEIPQRADCQCYYTWVEIPKPPGWLATNGEAINNHGHVVGRLLNMGDNQRGFIWTPEGGTQLMPMPPGAYSLQAYDMNDLGHVVGLLRMPGHYELPFFWDGQNYTIIEIPAWANFGTAFGINNQDQVVGQVLNNGTGPMRPFLWENGVLTELDASFGNTSVSARAITERGLIIGRAYFAGARQRAFQLENGVAELLELPAGFDQSFGYRSNDAAEIVGLVQYHYPSNPDYRSEAIRWRSNQAHIVPPDPLENLTLFTINDVGRAAGGCLLPGSLLTRIATYQNGAASDAQALMVPPPQPTTGYPRYALDINASGQILADEHGAGNRVLTPVWLAGDLTGDCHVSFEDLSLVLVNFGAPAGSFPRGDFDLDGDVDLSDLAILLSDWGS